MKKIFALALLTALSVASCSKEKSTDEETESNVMLKEPEQTSEGDISETATMEDVSNEVASPTDVDEAKIDSTATK